MTDQAKRVLLLTRTLSDSGVSTHLFTLAEGLVRAGWSVGIGSGGRRRNHPFGPERFESIGVPYFRIPFPRDYKRLSGWVAETKSAHRLRKVVTDFQPDVVHVHARSVSYHARLAVRRAGVPVVTTLHQTDIPADTLTRWFSYWGVAAIAVSTECHEDLVERFKLPPGRVHTIFNGVDPGHFRPASENERRLARSTLDLPDDALVMCLVGGTWLRKNSAALVRILGMPELAEARVFAIIAGGGPTGYLERLAADLGVLDQVRFPGYVDARSVFWASDVQVLPSRREAFPVAIVEGMMCGIPAIRTPSGGTRDQIRHGETGYIVEFDDEAGIAARIIALAEDPTLRHRLGTSAREDAVRRFTAEEMINRVAKVYLSALSGDTVSSLDLNP